MKDFIDKKTSNEEFDIQFTNTYIELEILLDSSNSYYLYIVPRTQNSAFVLASFDNTFDAMIEDLDEDQLEIICDTWPTLATLFYNGIKDKYSNGALIILEDNDNGDKKWFVSAIAGNIDFDSMEGVFTPRMLESIGLVLSVSQKLVIELSDNKPNHIRHGAKNLVKNAGKVVVGVGLATLCTYFGIDPSVLIE